jgi:hypothetical protein
MKPTPEFIRQAVEAAIIAEPTTNYIILAERFGVCLSNVKTIAKRAGINRPRGNGSPTWKLKPGSKLGRKPKAVVHG